jgi:hypothetical protein
MPNRGTILNKKGFGLIKIYEAKAVLFLKVKGGWLKRLMVSFGGSLRLKNLINF